MKNTSRNILIGFLLGILLVACLFALSQYRPERLLAPAENKITERASSPETAPEPTPVYTELPADVYEYLKVTDSCGPYYDGNPCLIIRSGPGSEFDKEGKLRNGVVLRVAGSIVKDGQTWYKIKFDEWLRYPERITSDWYVSGDYVQVFTEQAPENLVAGEKTGSAKLIVVNLNDQMLYAYDANDLYLKTPISSGKDAAPTGAGIFTIYRKTPTRYMQGPLPGISDEKYDLPGVPWDMYFTAEGAVIHGAYWHNKFGQPESHGCINVPPEIAEQLYYWADLGMKVVIVK